LEYFGLPVPVLASNPLFAEMDWCLLDHNQQDKVPVGVNVENIVCVIDHHQLLGNAIEISEPRMVDIQPWGSTTTILTFKYLNAKKTISRPVAGCLFAGVLSDTVYGLLVSPPFSSIDANALLNITIRNLRSPTTTEYDQMAVKMLEKIVGINRELFVEGLFKAKSNVEGLSMETITTTDYKSFTINGVHFGFGVIETTNPEDILPRKNELIEVLRKIKQEEQVSLMFFVVVDVLKLDAKMILIGPEEERAALASFTGTMVAPSVYDVGSLVSRKKDFIPPLSKFFKSESH